MSFELDPWMQTLRSELDQQMQPLFAETWPASFAQPCRYPLFGGGKRVRPALCVAAYEALGHTNRAPIYPAAIALELIHTYSLIHDDLPAMDDDDERRGRPTVHVAFDEAQAILAGDALLTEAFSVLVRSPLSDATRLKLIGRLAEASGYKGMVGGQAADIAGQPQNLSDLTRVHRQKTGALLQASAEFGALVGEASPQQFTAIAGFGERLGMVFQLADDLLDYEEDARPDGPPSFATFLGPKPTRQKAETLVNEAITLIEPLPKPEVLIALAHYFIKRAH